MKGYLRLTRELGKVLLKCSSVWLRSACKQRGGEPKYHPPHRVRPEPLDDEGSRHPFSRGVFRIEGGQPARMRGPFGSSSMLALHGRS